MAKPTWGGGGWVGKNVFADMAGGATVAKITKPPNKLKWITWSIENGKTRMVAEVVKC